jgi:hypothetical protein
VMNPSIFALYICTYLPVGLGCGPNGHWSTDRKWSSMQARAKVWPWCHVSCGESMKRKTFCVVIKIVFKLKFITSNYYFYESIMVANFYVSLGF